MTQHHQLISVLQAALDEDLPSGDITTEMMVDPEDSTTANIICKEDGIFYGDELITTLCSLVTPSITPHLFKFSGDTIQPGDIVCRLEGNTHVILKVERVLLNFLQRLSGIATQTRRCVDTLANTNIQILETRKTTPLLRFLEKAAVQAGGGHNHRQNLSDMILIKENHLSQLAKRSQSYVLAEKIHRFKQAHPTVKVELEIESPTQLDQHDLSEVDIIMFDNFSIDDINVACKKCEEKGYTALREVSGNITLDTLPQYANLPIHRISMGSLTHSVKALDLSLLIH